jgi:hypothetical protein
VETVSADLYGRLDPQMDSFRCQLADLRRLVACPRAAAPAVAAAPPPVPVGFAAKTDEIFSRILSLETSVDLIADYSYVQDDELFARIRDVQERREDDCLARSAKACSSSPSRAPCPVYNVACLPPGPPDEEWVAFDDDRAQEESSGG